MEKIVGVRGGVILEYLEDNVASLNDWRVTEI